MKKRRRKPQWQKSLDKGLVQVIKKQRRIRTAKQDIRLKAAKGRQKKMEKSINNILSAGCFIIFLVAAYMEIIEIKKNKK